MARKQTCRLCTRPRLKNGYCQVHQNEGKKLSPTPKRKESNVWRSRKGRQFRQRYLRDHPYCHDCMTLYARPVPATQVHHLQTQLERPDLVLDRDNCMALCEPCHDARHGRGVGGSES